MNVRGSDIMHMEGVLKKLCTKEPEKRSEEKKCEPGEA
jgi:hypothetical protein